MDVGEEIRPQPGVFALMHQPSATVYINRAANLRHRALVWAAHLARMEADPDYHPPAKMFPRHPAAEWQLWVDHANALDAVRKLFADDGWKVLNDVRPVNRLDCVQDGTTHTDTVRGHAKRVGLPVTTVYKRLERGYTLEQALGLSPLSPQDSRDRAIELMKLKIVTDDGGFVTYDEALQMRPELGDIRTKLKKMRLRHPDVVQVLLKEIA
jgi:hypothetical protein